MMVPELGVDELRLREAGPPDVPHLVLLRNGAREWFFDPNEVTSEGTLAWLDRSKAAGELNWVVEAKGEVIGTISAIPSDRGVEVGRMIVAPAHQGRGVMKRALRMVVEALADHFPGPIFLEVRPDNGKARNLYENVGFTVTRLRMEWHDPAV